MCMFKQHNGQFTLDCLQELNDSLAITSAMAPSFWVCYKCAIKNPTHLEQDSTSVASVGATTISTITNKSTTDKSAGDGVDSICSQLPVLQQNVEELVLKGLQNYQLKPSGLRGVELFEHMIKFWELHRPVKECFCKYTTKVSNYLDVPISHTNKCVLLAKGKHVCGEQVDLMRNIMADLFGTQAKMKLKRQKLDAICGFKRHCSVLNLSDALAKRENARLLGASIAEIEMQEAANKKVPRKV